MDEPELILDCSTSLPHYASSLSIEETEMAVDEQPVPEIEDLPSYSKPSTTLWAEPDDIINPLPTGVSLGGRGQKRTVAFQKPVIIAVNIDRFLTLVSLPLDLRLKFPVLFIMKEYCFFCKEEEEDDEQARGEWLWWAGLEPRAEFPPSECLCGVLVRRCSHTAAVFGVCVSDGSLLIGQSAAEWSGPPESGAHFDSRASVSELPTSDTDTE